MHTVAFALALQVILCLKILQNHLETPFISLHQGAYALAINVRIATDNEVTSRPTSVTFPQQPLGPSDSGYDTPNLDRAHHDETKLINGLDGFAHMASIEDNSISETSNVIRGTVLEQCRRCSAVLYACRFGLNALAWWRGPVSSTHQGRRSLDNGFDWWRSFNFADDGNSFKLCSAGTTPVVHVAKNSMTFNNAAGLADSIQPGNMVISRKTT
ncbi:putative effector protein [Ceratobasidium theobromae]|uniref:Putative effector protein n=1 Tax=Ceratobasidium theobromae TaxID=1582974 RepID=A0A5N5QWL9_9AGAM|nr:putative effector protein [Ceratobasidium theobromae]